MTGREAGPEGVTEPDPASSPATAEAGTDATGIAPLAGRIAVVTGGGRGLGRQHALLLAKLGAHVVVNDSGGAIDGSGRDPGPASLVAEEIRSAGGEAVASTDDVSDWEGGRRVVHAALEAFGDLHVVVNNAGIVRDRFLVNMSEAEFDDVVRVHLKGHFVVTRWAAEHWRARAKSGQPVRAAVINTSSTSGLAANPGQANYGAAKAGIAAFTMVAAAELSRYGVRCNAVAPVARTRLTESTPGLVEMLAPPAGGAGLDVWDPAHVSPLIGWLATESCPVSGEVFLVHGGRIQRYHPWSPGESVETDQAWTITSVESAVTRLLAY